MQSQRTWKEAKRDRKMSKPRTAPRGKQEAIIKARGLDRAHGQGLASGGGWMAKLPGWKWYDEGLTVRRRAETFF